MMKVAPLLCPSLSARIVPRCISTIALLIARPSPRPSRPESACSNGSKILLMNCGSDPHAAVTDLDGDRLWVRIVRSHRNRAVFRRELASVAKNAPENFLQAWRIRDEFVPGSRQSDHEL